MPATYRHRATTHPLLGWCFGLVALASVSCAKPFLVANFETVYRPRTNSFALAPIANLSTEPEGAKAGAAIREAIYYELSRRQDQYTVQLQDIAVTDQRLRAAGISDSSAARLPGRISQSCSASTP